MTVEAMLDNAVLIEGNGPGDEVGLGSRVTVVEHGFDPESYTIVGSAEANPADGRISNESPLGKALLNHKAGDTVQVEAPVGAFTIVVVKVE